MLPRSMRSARTSQNQSKPTRPLGVQRRTYISVVNGRNAIPRIATRALPMAASNRAGRASQMNSTPKRGNSVPKNTSRQPNFSPPVGGSSPGARQRRRSALVVRHRVRQAQGTDHVSGGRDDTSRADDRRDGDQRSLDLLERD